MADTAAQIATIPLRCSICPKMPKFSDLSHLLTHVSAKGHLSNHFRISVRTSTDPIAREQLEEFSHWYQLHGIEHLLAERMSKKDARALTQTVKLESGDERGLAPLASAPSSPGLEKSKAPSDLQPELLDPRLTVQGVKQESSLLSDGFPSESTSNHRGCVPSKALRPTSDQQDDEMALTPTVVSNPRPSYGTIGSPCPYPLLNQHNQVTRFAVVSPGTSISSPATSIVKTDAGESFDQERKRGGEIQLKGVYWPGMDMFDSATPEMKRKRNQKKDGSLAAHLEVCSTLVEATERMFGSGGDLQRERPISRLLEESPIKETTDHSKKRRILSKRLPLIDRSLNARRKSGSRDIKPGPRSGMGKRRMMASAGSPLAIFARQSTPRRGLIASESQFGGLQLGSNADLDDDFRLTYGSPLRKRRSFAIFQDTSDNGNVSTKKLPHPTQLESVFSFRSPLTPRVGIRSGTGFANHSPLRPITSADPFIDGRGPEDGTAKTREVSNLSYRKETAIPSTEGLGTHQAHRFPGLEKHPRCYPLEGAHPPAFMHSLTRHFNGGTSVSNNTGVYGFSSNPLVMGDLRRDSYTQPLGLDGAWSPRSIIDQIPGGDSLSVIHGMEGLDHLDECSAEVLEAEP